MPKKDVKNKPVDSRSYVVDSLVKASSSIENAFNAVNSFDYTTSATGLVNNSQTWNYGHSNPINYTTSSVSGYPSQTLIYNEPSNVYPKIDIQKITEHKFCPVNLKDVNKKWPNFYVVFIYLAGVSKDRVKLTFEKGTYVGNYFHLPKMTVQIDADKSNQDFQKEWFLKESKQSFTNRTIHLPDDSDVFNITDGKMENGILSFNIPVTEKRESPSEIVTLKIN